jgi:hypothetical protein
MKGMVNEMGEFNWSGGSASNSKTKKTRRRTTPGRVNKTLNLPKSPPSYTGSSNRTKKRYSSMNSKKINELAKEMFGVTDSELGAFNPASAYQRFANELASNSRTMINPYARYNVQRNTNNPFAAYNITPNVTNVSNAGKEVSYSGSGGATGMGDLRKYEASQSKNSKNYRDMNAGTGTEQGTLGEFLAWDRLMTEEYLSSLLGDGGGDSGNWWGGYGGGGGGYGSYSSPYNFFFDLLNWRF